jgi:hypothetical protein
MTDLLAETNWNAKEAGQRGGKRAADLFLKRFVEGSHAEIRDALPATIDRAKVEASAMLTSDDPNERLVAVHWLAFYSELETALATAKAGRAS